MTMKPAALRSIVVLIDRDDDPHARLGGSLDSPMPASRANYVPLPAVGLVE
jgi:hypothetical protein